MLAQQVLCPVLGLVFWMIAGRCYSDADIGIANAGLSSASLIACFSDLGLGIAIIRFWPSATNDIKQLLNYSISIGISVAGIASGVSFFIFPYLVDSPSALQTTAISKIFLISVTIFTVADYMIGSAFLRLRANHYGLAQNVIVYLLRIAIVYPFFLVFGDSSGLIIVTLISQLGLLVWVLFRLVPKVIPGYRYVFTLRFSLTKLSGREIVSYCGGNYLARFLLEAHVQIVPLACLTILGADVAGQFMFIWFFALMFRAIPTVMFNSLLAEGANATEHLKRDLYRTVRLQAVIHGSALLVGIPTVIAIIGPLFARSFTVEMSWALLWLALASIPWSFNYLCINLSRLQHQSSTTVLAAATVFVCVAIFVVSGLFLKGVAWGAFGYCLGQCSAVAIIRATIWPTVKPHKNGVAEEQSELAR